MAILFELHAVGLRAALDGRFILNGLSFTLESGEFVGLVGPSGSGKTSLLRLLNRLQDCTHGRLQFQGRPIDQTPVLKLRQQVVLVGQEPHLLGMTVQTALEYPLGLRGLDAQTAQQRINLWLERLQIPREWLPRTELQLSVGQRQRVALARALALEPLVLLLDEPTSALDIGQSERLMEQFSALCQAQKTTVLMTNHQLQWVERYCDRVVLLLGGELAGVWPSDKVKWPELRRQIAEAKQQEQQEWGEIEG